MCFSKKKSWMYHDVTFAQASLCCFVLLRLLFSLPVTLVTALLQIEMLIERRIDEVQSKG